MEVESGQDSVYTCVRARIISHNLKTFEFLYKSRFSKVFQNGSDLNSIFENMYQLLIKYHTKTSKI